MLLTGLGMRTRMLLSPRTQLTKGGTVIATSSNGGRRRTLLGSHDDDVNESAVFAYCLQNTNEKKNQRRRIFLKRWQRAC